MASSSVIRLLSQHVIPGSEIAGRLEAFRAGTTGVVRVVHGRPNVRYLTGYDGGGAPLWLIVDDDLCALVHYTADEDSLAALESSGVQLHPYAPEDDPRAVLQGALERFGGRRLFADLDWWAATDASALGSEAGDCSEVLTGLRAVKSPWEREQLRRAGAITAAVMRCLEESADGRTGPELAALLYGEAIARGSGAFTCIPYVAVGDATFENHTTWDWHERAGVGDQTCGSYLFEFATAVDGYAVPLSRSRTDSPEGQRALEAVERGVGRIREGLVPGADPRELHGRMYDSLSNAGFRFAHRAGYSIGLGDLETWMEGSVARLGPREERPIAAGMAFHVVGSVVQPGRFGVARSASLLVTEDGCEELTA
jgi:Xaa-Pro dipeptidase